MSEEALATIRRCSSLNGARQAAQSRPVDLYHRGQGYRFTIGAAELATLVRRGLQVTNCESALQVDEGGNEGVDDTDTQALVQLGTALLAWLE